ncbi:MAG: prepilin-type N-terminal cleavage/methylation domain-containing protein [Lachnospiraceae bacterium]|nr:prepilin-type N-terminal cleavage/methylation domain-containing protein [Lachnospiraceae bacterium]
MNDKKSRKVNNAQSGFTLVELIVVLVVLAILAAILVPAFLGYIDDSRRKEEYTNAKMVYTALQSKLTTLYDQGISANQGDPDEDGKRTTGKGASAYMWNSVFTEDVFYASGLKERPYLCGFFAGSFTKKGTGRYTYAGKSISGLKKSYTVCALVYMETSLSKPVFYYNGEFRDEPPVFGSDEGCKTLGSDKDKVYLAELCVLAGCGGSEKDSASGTWEEALNSVE